MLSNVQLQSNAQTSTEQQSLPSNSCQRTSTEQQSNSTLLQHALFNPKSLLPGDILQLQKAIGNQAVIQLLSSETAKPPSSASEEGLLSGKAQQPGPNHTGMPDELKSGIEAMSGLDMSDVRVHHNSNQPRRIGALAFTQGSHIYIGPGQEKHLPHEAWHVVQQKQGRVRPTLRTRGLLINDNVSLEKESDIMGARALQMKRLRGIRLNEVLTANRHCSEVLASNSTPVLQARFWDSDMTQPLSLSTLTEKISQAYPQYSQKMTALEGMHLEEVDYILPAKEEEYKSTLEAWVDAYENQDLINVTKMINIINSILANGILNQTDRQNLLDSSNKAKTSTDDEKGSKQIHGITIEQQDSEANQQHANEAQQQSVNVLAEVKDDLIISGTKKRILAGLLSQDERQYIMEKWMELLTSFSSYTKLKNQLIENSENPGFVKVDIGTGYVFEDTLNYAINKVANSKRGRNEINKRMMTGFLSIVDSENIPEENWDMKPTPFGEGVVTASIPPTLILKMILPKYLEKYSDQIINTHGVPIVYQYIEYPAESEIHLYSPNTGTFKLRNEINLMWKEQINAALKDKKEIFTHMTRGF